MFREIVKKVTDQVGKNRGGSFYERFVRVRVDFTGNEKGEGKKLTKNERERERGMKK